jgi:hypothetical protein
LQRLLWSEGAVLVDPAASKETVMHHALGKQKNGDGQPNQKQELSNLEQVRLSLAGAALSEFLAI